MERRSFTRRKFSRDGSLFYRQYIQPIWRLILFTLFLGIGITFLVLAYALGDIGYGFGHDLFVSFAIIFLICSLWFLRKII
jgi:hypothetical protein